MKTDEEIQQHCDECGLGKWAWAACEGANCTGDGVIEDTFDGLCRWCSCEEERPTDPAAMPPPMSAEADEWTAWFYRFYEGEPNQSQRGEHTCSGLPN
jgi:hypothetical protein